MNSTIILSPDKEAYVRLRILVNLLFPDVVVFCTSDSKMSSENCPANLHPNYSPVSRGNDPCKS